MLEESHLQIAERGESNIFVWRVQRDSETLLTGLSLSLSLRALMLLSPYVKTITTTTNNTQHTPKIILNWQVLETLLHIFWHSDKMLFLQENLSWVRRQDQVLHCMLPWHAVVFLYFIVIPFVVLKWWEWLISDFSIRMLAPRGQEPHLHGWQLCFQKPDKLLVEWMNKWVN